MFKRFFTKTTAAVISSVTITTTVISGGTTVINVKNGEETIAEVSITEDSKEENLLVVEGLTSDELVEIIKEYYD